MIFLQLSSSPIFLNQIFHIQRNSLGQLVIQEKPTASCEVVLSHSVGSQVTAQNLEKLCWDFFSEATHPWNTRQREVQFVQVLEVTKSQHPHWKICVFYIFFWKIWFLGCRVENQTNSFSCTPSDVKSQWCASARLGGEVARELPLCPTFKGQPFLNLAGFSSKNGTQKMSSWRCKITF